MSREFYYPSADGIHAIHAVEWLPQGTPRGVVQIVHGVAEYAERYETLAQFLTDHGFVVCGEDHLGHGKTVTDGKFGYFAPKDGWNLVTRDVRRLRELERKKFPNLPYVMLGHSMGSFLTRTYLIRWPGTVDAAVLSGTGQEPAPLVAFGRGLTEGVGLMRGPDHVNDLVYALSMGAYNRKFRPNRTTADWLSRDTERVDANLADPLCAFRPTVSMFRDMMTGLQLIGNPRYAARMDRNTPIYFMSGDQDPVGGMGKGVRRVARMFRRAGCTDVTVRLYPGGRHEMFHELNRSQVMEDLLTWLDSRLPAPAQED